MSTNAPSFPAEGRAHRRFGTWGLPRALRAVLAAAATAGVTLAAQTAWADPPAHAAASVEGSSDKDASALTRFRAPLSRHGAWIEDPTFGTVWVPSRAVVGAGFVPYQTAGHWTLNERGDWQWKSEYPWGHIAFHYGRWAVSSERGWVWIPGRAYAPAWVVWRLGDPEHVGWAPMAPSFRWVHGRAASIAAPLPATYSFVPAKYAFQDKLGMYVVRDAAAISRAISASHDYRPVNASGRVAVGEAVSPPLAVAHVPVWAAPRPVAEDPRAVALSKPPPGRHHGATAHVAAAKASHGAGPAKASPAGHGRAAASGANAAGHHFQSSVSLGYQPPAQDKKHGK